jgi:hypothetical protein
MSAKTVSVFILGLIVAGAMSGILLMGYQSQISALEEELDQLQAEYDTLQGGYNQKAAEYNNLNSMYSSVQSQRDALQADLNAKEGYLKEVSTDLSGLYDLLNSYSNLEDSLLRILNSGELDKIGDAVTQITDTSEDIWGNYRIIWEYVDDNVVYAYDTEFPYISSYSYITLDGVECFTEFTVGTRLNYHQTPEFTLTNKQGDCDDQAILLYGMMRYYLRNVYGTVYNSYLALISFTDETAHLAIFMPVQGGEICILDPAGNYATERYGSLTSKAPSTELQSFADHWSAEHVIETIKLYWVDDRDGSFSSEFEGSLEDAVKFFETT